MYQKKKKKKSYTLKVLIATVSFKVVPLGAYTMIPTFLPRSEAVLKSFCVSVFSTFCYSAWISSMVSNLHPFHLIFILGKRKKSQGAKGRVRGWGTTVMFLEAKNAAQPKRYAWVHCRDGAPSCSCAICLAASASGIRSRTLH
jgi:hypothetical protein